MPVFRFNKVFRIVRGAKAFLNLEGGATRGAIPGAGPHEDQAEGPKQGAWRLTSEQEKRIEGESQESSRIGRGRLAAKHRIERSERKKRKKARQERVDRYASEKRRDPPQERIETAQLRQPPGFVIIGTQRGGTTSLYRYLTEHPDVGQALRKGVHFFSRYYEKGMDWYLAHFPLREEVSVVGEASPNYLIHPEAPERIREAIPHAKFITLLRNPVDRAYSQYYMNVRKGLESLSFEDAIDQERERLRGNADPDDLTRLHHSYIQRGLYMDQLERWMSVFPREQFLIIKSEDFYENPERVLQQTLAYLGLRPWRQASFRAYHLSEYADMNPATRKRLREYFAPYNQQLYAFLGRDLGWEHDQ